MTRSTRFVRRAAGPIGAIALAAAIAWQLDLGAITAHLAGMAPGWFAAAIALLLASNVVSALRWVRIARGLGLVLGERTALRLYFQAAVLNTALPGAVVGGDLWRAAGAHRAGNPRAASALSVFADRAGGLWVLCVIGCVCLAIAAASGQLHGAPTAAFVTAVALAAGALLPVWPGVRRLGAALPDRPLARRVSHLTGALGDAQQQMRATAGWSLLVQALSIGALQCAAAAVGVALPWPVAGAVAAGVFVAASLPVSVGGFGTREAAAAGLFPLAAASHEAGVAAGVAYGLAQIVQSIGAFALAPPGDPSSVRKASAPDCAPDSDPRPR